MANKQLILEARAKVNLALDVLFKRSDGYHEVMMVMQSIALSDRVGLYEQAAGITLSTNISELACGEDNLAYRAAALIVAACGVRRGIHIVLEKRIPMAAGLAGGSTDAAAVLKGLNRLWNLGLRREQLLEMAVSLGSDVPFCLQGGTKLATGRGELLSQLSAMPHTWVVLAKLPVAVSTAWVYGNYHIDEAATHPDVPGLTASLARQDLPGVAARLGNVLESVTISAYPEIAKLKEHMLEYGALASLMTGSGPTVFALTADRIQAEFIAKSIQKHTNAQIIVTETACELEEEYGT